MLDRSIQIQKYEGPDLFAGHYYAYRRFAEYSGLEIVEQPLNRSTYVIPYSESNTDWNPRMPYALCDKSLNQPLFRQAGFETLQTSILEDCQNLPSYDFIIKPAVGGGSISKHTGTYTINPPFVSPACVGTCIVQESITKPGEEYIQLYVEGFVNTRSDIAFTSIHEIVFRDNIWVRQIDTKITFDIINILSKIKNMVRAHNVGNCMFLLQFLRRQDDTVWYPTDWQYRLSYNTVFGKSVVEPEYCQSAVQYMIGNSLDVIPQKYKYYQGTVPITDSLIEKIKKTNTTIVPVKPKQLNSALIITHGHTFEEAKSVFEFLRNE